MKRWQTNLPIAFDDSSQRLFIGYRNPSRLITFDPDRGVPTANLKISGDSDNLFLEAKRQ